jgi:2-polyprenyl-6-methoxyphenol hydroxylase-like FAD-dependent oxidoreductase
MPKIVVLGGGVCGLAAGMLLARDGHEVTVLERDPEPAPESSEHAWSSWDRRGVVQFRGPHFLQARVREVLDAQLPDVRDALLAAGAARVDPIDRMPAAIADRTARPVDERLVSISARRPTVEYVFARAAEAEPGLAVRRGVTAVALTTQDGSPRVTGVRTDAGDELRADLVVDAMGRGSRLPRLLRAAGIAPLHEEAEDCGFVYFTRFFRGEVPRPRTGGLATPIGSFTMLTLPSDRSTWCVALYVAADDRPLKRLKDPDRWSAVVAACPLHAHWLDGEPIGEVTAMGGVLDRYRRLVVDDRPVATGLALLADSWACTNPSLARGLSLGLDHAARLRDVARSHLDDPLDFSEAWDALTEAEFTPWYRATVAVDRARLAEIDAIRRGESSPVDGVPARFAAAAMRDPELFRAFFEIVGCLTLPGEIFARPCLAERVLELTADGAPGPPGPTRSELLELVG